VPQRPSRIADATKLSFPKLWRRRCMNWTIVTFRVSRRRREMHCGHPRLCVCLSVCLSAAACLHYCTDPDVTWRSDRGCLLVLRYCANLQSGHGLRCHGNITRTRNVREYMLVLAVCLVLKVFSFQIFRRRQCIANGVKVDR